MKPIELHADAAEEVRESIAFVGSVGEEAGEEFETALEAALKLIARQPKAFSPYRTHYRRYVLTQYGYLIFYEELDDRVLVYAVTHGSRRPDHWLNRTPHED